MTSTHHAAAGSGEAIEFLLGYGLDLNQQDIDGWAPLDWATSGRSVPCVRRLLDINALDEDGKKWMPCAFAMFRENIEVAALLKPTGHALPNVLDFQHFSDSLLQTNILRDGCDLVNDTGRGLSKQSKTN